MEAAERSYNLDVSETYFRLTTESVRLHSNMTYKHATFSDVVNGRAQCAEQLPAMYNGEKMKEHLRIVPADGEHPISFTILETNASKIDGAIPELERALGTSIKFAEAVSLMLYDLLIEANATEVLIKLGLTAEEAREYRKCQQKDESNIIPFR